MGDRVLIGTDGSERSADALALGRRLADLLGAEPVLVYAHPYGRIEDLLGGGEEERLVRELVEQSARQAREQLGGDGAPEMRLLTDPSPAAALHRAAEDTGARAIVVGSSHRGAVGRVLPGGVPQRLLSGAPCPVAVAPVGYAARTAPEPEAVGCAYDASPEAERALRLAAELARGGRRTLRVVTVHEPILIPEFGRSSRPLDERLRASLEEGLAAAVETSGLGDAAEPVLRRGAPAAELADESEGLGLLVMGSRGYGPVGAVLLGSVAARVVRESACPVIVVPRQG